MTGDVNFDGIATAFERDIYGSSKGRVRLAVLWTDLLESVPGLSEGGHRILDAGGGSGHIALRLAQLDNEVVLCEPSREMLDRAQAAIDDAGLGEKISTFHGGIQELDQLAGGESFDVIACHAVLEWLADPRDAVEHLARRLEPTGYLSLMFYNRNAALMKTVLSGRFAAALHERDADPTRQGWGEGATPFAADTVTGWLFELGLRVRSKAGIRIFHDHVHDESLIEEHFDELLEVEKALRQVEPFASLGQHIHLVAQSSP
jgi:S-adenosylmethionine-dependent methyltransferase